MEQWHKQRKAEHFYRLAKSENYRARSAYKLIEIDKRFHIFKKGFCVLDIGAAPGSWSQVACEKIGPAGYLLAVDILPMAPLPEKSFHFLRLDLFKPEASKRILESLPRKADAMISDVAPEFSGIRLQDIGLANDLSEICFEIAKKVLKEGGNFVCKIFQSAELQVFVKNLKEYFKNVEIFKPKSSLGSSSEIYIIAKSFSQNKIL